MKIGVLGSGDVAQVLASGFLKHGHTVTMGTRDSSKLTDWASRNSGGRVGSFADAARFGELLVLAAKGSAAADVLRLVGQDALAGKPVIDASNPIADAAPVNGVVRFFTDLNESLMERLQREFPAANLVKAFSCVGKARMIDPDFEAGKPTMFICGNDEGAKRVVTELLTELGWDTADMGKAEAARAIEPLCMLWLIPALLRKEFTHAFALLKS
jgi:8-hydroxy-5-deazaflavin:NADPH oxidoreductase